MFSWCEWGIRLATLLMTGGSQASRNLRAGLLRKLLFHKKFSCNNVCIAYYTNCTLKTWSLDALEKDTEDLVQDLQRPLQCQFV